MTAGRLRPRLGPGPQIVVVVLVVGLFGALAIEPTRQLLDQRERLSGMTQDLRGVERSNDRLEARIERLKKDRRRGARQEQPPPPEPGFVEAFMQFIGIP